MNRPHRSRGPTVALASLVAAGAAFLASAGAGADARTAAAPLFDPSRFTHPTEVDNRWLPLVPGTSFMFTGSSNDGKKRLVFTVTDLVKVVGGVANVVVWDRDFTDGALVEAELAFFAQDDDGNVWHTGEYPEEYEDGRIVGVPAWLAGVRGARAGIEMQAHPHLGTPVYRQGYAPPPVSWNDHATVYKVGLRSCVPYRCFGDVLVTREFTPGEPGSQLKYYAAGIGNMRVGWLGKDPDREALVLAAVVRLNAAGLARARHAALELDRNAYRTRPKVYGRTRPAARPS